MTSLLSSLADPLLNNDSLAAEVRADFPVLARQVHSHPLIYLDNAATSQKPKSVLAAMETYYTHSNANVHRGVHTLSNEATDAYEGSRQKVARFIQAADVNEIVFTRNATEAINLVAYSWGMSTLEAGDEVILSVMEHHSNLVPWQILAKKTGSILKFVRVTETGSLDMDHFRSCLSNRTKLVSIVHISNTLGCINPIAEIIALAHHYGAKVLIDACQSVPHRSVNVQDLDCDWLAFSSHKMCGPTGIGCLYGKRDLLREMPPFLGGGEMIAEVFLDHFTYADLPHKFEAGTPAIAEAVGLGAAIDYLTTIGMDRIQAHEEALVSYLYKELQAIPGITVYGPEKRSGLVSFSADVAHAHDLSTLLDESGIAIRAGHHCTQPLHRYLNVAATARASVYLYTTQAEIDQFLWHLKDTIEFFRTAGA
jgi:cysteine desulfurase/selenocysteine lyase